MAWVGGQSAGAFRRQQRLSRPCSGQDGGGETGVTRGWAREGLECAPYGLGVSPAGKGQEGVKSVEGPSEGWGTGWDMLVGVQARG